MRGIRTLAAALALGWLASGTCHISYCSDDCDPCIEECHCHKSTCHRTGLSWAFVHTLARYERGDERNPDGSLHRTFGAIRGLSTARAGGSAAPSSAEAAFFARNVLAANRALFGRPAEAFTLLDALACESGILVRYQRDEAGQATDLVTFLFDPRGNLLEIAHDRRADTGIRSQARPQRTLDVGGTEPVSTPPR